MAIALLGILLLVLKLLQVLLGPSIELNLLPFRGHNGVPVDENLLQSCDALLEGVLHQL